MLTMTRSVGNLICQLLLCIILFVLSNSAISVEKNVKRTLTQKQRQTTYTNYDPFDVFARAETFNNNFQGDDSLSEIRTVQEFLSDAENKLQWDELSAPQLKSESHDGEDFFPSEQNSKNQLKKQQKSKSEKAYTKLTNHVDPDVHDPSLERHDRTPIISTRYGQVQGTYRGVAGHTSRVAVFLGIPYATPPVNANRLSPTRAATQWRGVLTAITAPPACPQKPPKQFQRLFQHQNEDCLYLNIYVPDGVQSASVVVVIHGESFTWGSGSAYDGSLLANRGQLIVVTLNYRLGILGFLNPSSPQQRPTVANYGLMDQLAALHWLQENIASFGGDPAQVTVLGRSHAAAALNFLILSPAAAGAGLFKRVVMLSGSALSPWALVKDPGHYAQQISQQMRCVAARPEHPTIEEMIVCLRNRTVHEIMDVSLETPQFLSSMGPSIDGVTITHDWQQQMSKMGKEGRTPVDILLGVSEIDVMSAFTPTEILHGFDEDHRDRIFRTFVTNNYHYHLQELVLAITAEYTDWSRPSQPDPLVRDQTAAALHDASVVAPVTAAAVNLASKDRNLYYYVLDNKPRDQNPHAAPLTELSYILGPSLGSVSTQLIASANRSRAELVVTDAFINYLSNFVRTGDPNESEEDLHDIYDQDKKKQKSQSWEKFDATYRRYLELRPSNTRMRDHYRADQVALWTWLIPGLERVGSRHGLNSTLHRFVGGPGIFSGPTRPNSFLPPPPTISPQSDTSVFPGDEALPPQSKNGTLGMAQDASVKDRLGHTSSNSLLGEDELGLPYTTALSLTAALGVTLLLLNVLVLAAVHYRKANHQKIPHNRQQGLSPSHCGTLNSSTTLRSLACPQDWPPEYTTCYPENIPQMQVQKHDCNKKSLRTPSLEQQNLLSPQDQLQQQLQADQQHEQVNQQYQHHNTPMPTVEELENTNAHQILQHHLHSTSSTTSSPPNSENQSRTSLRQAKVHNGFSTMKLVRKPSPPPRSSSVPPSESEQFHSSLVNDHDPG